MIDWLACALVRSVGWWLCRLPPSVCVRLGDWLGQLAYFIQPKRARTGYLNLKAAFGRQLPPAQAKRTVRRVFGQLGAGLVEMLRLPALDERYVNRYIEFAGLCHIDAAVASGRPVVFLTGHFGNWELCSIVGALKGYPIVALARAQERLPRLYRLLVSYRESKGCRIVHKGGAMKQLIQALDRRELVGIVGDQASRQGIFVDFFGRPALFATGPFELARTKGAVILPIFMHRKRGPFHRLVVEPPIGISQSHNAQEAIRAGIEGFAKALARHIEHDPAQWLWLHKRWKHTPARRLLVLSDGKPGHLKQSLAVLQAAKERSADVDELILEIRYRNRLSRAAALVWAWLMPLRVGSLACLRMTLTPDCFRQLACRYADLIVSCGASTIAVNVLLSRENRAKSVVIMNPRPIPLERFSLAFIPIHDGVQRRPNVIQTYGALSVVQDGQLHGAMERLREHPRFRPARGLIDRRPVIAVFLGGDTPEYRFTKGFTEGLLRQVLAVCEESDGFCLLTSSRRTPAEIEQACDARLSEHPRCLLLLLASRDALDLPAAPPTGGSTGAAPAYPDAVASAGRQAGGTVEGMLGWAQVAVVTSESISMVSEACASGKHVVAVEPPLRKTHRVPFTKSRRFISALADSGCLHSCPLPEVGHAIRRCLSDRPPVRRLDTYPVVRDAVAKLL